MNRRIRLQKYLTPAKRKHLSRLWILGTIIYDIVRAFTVAHIFSKYGVNRYYYLTFELFISLIFSVASLRLVLALVDNDRGKIMINLLLTSAAFFAPEAYVIIAGDNVPTKLLVILGIYLTITFTITAFMLLHDVKKKRAERKLELLEESFEVD
jgi:hypothetical protein